MPVGDDQVLVMVQVQVRAATATLHNYAAHLLLVRGGRIVRLAMVEAKPAESDRFWA